MKIKNKLLLGFGLLFVVVVFFGVVAIYYIEDISEYSKVTVKNNYETLTFTRSMRAVLDENDLPLNAKAAGDFENALKKQENNITEPGEKEATAGLRTSFTDLTATGQGADKMQQAERTARLQLKTIEGLNMHAIVDKNNHIHTMVSNATIYLGGIVFVTFLILFVFIVNFPGFILNPLNQFIEGVHQINQKNYEVKMELDTNDEFSSLATEFNAMAGRLSDGENENATRILAGEHQVKILMEEMPDVVIGLNEKKEVLFANAAARKILKLEDDHVMSESAREALRHNPILKKIIETDADEAEVKLPLHGKSLAYHLKRIEIVVPNLRPVLYTLQFSAFNAGMIYVLKNKEV